MMSQCCMNCACSIGYVLLLCGRRSMGRLYVDAFYCCPLWGPKRRHRHE